jgi:hypothetical protein
MAPLTRTRRWRSERGAELVEFALVLPLLLLTVLGIVDFGLALQRFEVVNNAAREGVRVAILPDYGPVDADARVRQFLLASGLDDPDVGIDGPVHRALPLGVSGRCLTVVEMTVSYPHEYLFLSGIIGYFGGTLDTTSLSATVGMRSEGPSLSCS